MVRTVYEHCHNCGYYQPFRVGDPEITVSDGETMTVYGPDNCWLCGEVYVKVLKP